MLYYLSHYTDEFGPLRLFDYVTFRAGGAFVLAFIIVLIAGKPFAAFLRRWNVMAADRLVGLIPDEFIDKKKNATPCMGGLLLVGAVLISSLLWTRLDNLIALVFIGTVAAFMVLGFYDDYIKVFRRNRDGLSKGAKLIWQTVISSAALACLCYSPEIRDLLQQFYVPFVKTPVYCGFLCLPFAVLVMVATVNAVNFTDGKDGLATGCTIFCTLTYGVFIYLMSHKIFASYLSIPYIHGAEEAVVFAAGVCGGCIGFLWHNCYPASMFMGDTGSLALGGSVGLLAVLVRQELLLLLVGGVFVIEGASVLIQTFTVRFFGKRLFLCTPIHHHFERSWTETQIVVRFWILSGVFALLALATLKLR
jgi:phospho-N-acetylmuramoyl-pentapeptide-transferase